MSLLWLGSVAGPGTCRGCGQKKKKEGKQRKLRDLLLARVLKGKSKAGINSEALVASATLRDIKRRD